MTIREAGQLLRGRKVSSHELTTGCLRTIEQRDPSLNAFITVMADVALAEAGARDAAFARGEDLGPLHGIPVAVKDVFETKGVRTTCGSKLFAANVPNRDAAVVERLRAAGAVLLGKTNMHELAYGITSTNPHYGAVHNPWDVTRIPGGSSGGSGAAVAAGMCFLAMGSDTGGSIRIPASFCGTVGLKPTYGRVSRYGVMPLDFSLDHMGPLTRSVWDAAAALDALAGWDARDDTSSPAPAGRYAESVGKSIAGLRVGLPENYYFDRLEPAVADAVRALSRRAEERGARVMPVRVPDIEALNVVGRVILLVEAASALKPYLDRRGEIGPDVLALLDQGRLIAGTDYVNAQRLRRRMQEEFRALFAAVDCLLTPATPCTAPPIGQLTVTVGGVEEDARLASTRLVRGVNVLGLPALSLPCGADANNLPIGAQLIGRAFEEETLLRLGAALEQEPR